MYLLRAVPGGAAASPLLTSLPARCLATPGFRERLQVSCLAPTIAKHWAGWLRRGWQDCTSLQACQVACRGWCAHASGRCVRVQVCSTARTFTSSTALGKPASSTRTRSLCLHAPDLTHEGVPGQLDASPAGRPLGLSYAEGCDPSTPPAAAAWAPARMAPVAVRLPAAVPAITIPSKAFEQGAGRAHVSEGVLRTIACLQEACSALPALPSSAGPIGACACLRAKLTRCTWQTLWRHRCVLRQSCSPRASSAAASQRGAMGGGGTALPHVGSGC
jgi:hypothetical protein